MIGVERRMPRFERVPLRNPTQDEIARVQAGNDGSNEFSVIRLRHAALWMGNFDEIAREAVKNANTDERRMAEISENIETVRTTDDYKVLFGFLSSTIGRDAMSPLIRKLRSQRESLYKDVLAKLTNGYNDIFMDNALAVLGNEFDHQDIGDEIIAALETNKIRDALDFASLLMVLGRSRNVRYTNLLYSFTVFFKDNFPGKGYHEGPLFALIDVIADSSDPIGD